ncbi:MAG: hypothetical protein V4725_04085, partial [Bacteroidota bacterium]
EITHRIQFIRRTFHIPLHIIRGTGNYFIHALLLIINNVVLFGQIVVLYYIEIPYQQNEP